MNLDRYTQKAIQAILEALQLAKNFSPETIAPEHLLTSLVRQPEGGVSAIVARIAGSPAMLLETLEKGLAGRPRVSGAEGQPALGRATSEGLNAAERQASRMKEEG